MKRLSRTPLRFETFNLFAIYGRDEVVSIREPGASDNFRALLGKHVDESLLNRAFVYGHLAESMFVQLVAALDEARLIKQEDAGELYVQDQSLKIPDFRILLADGTAILVEVKNFHQKTGREPYEIGERYLQGLENTLP